MIAMFASRGGRGKMWASSSFILPLAMIGFALVRALPLSLVMMMVMGYTLITIMNNCNAMVQSSVPDELRGRVMGLYSLMFMGGGPIGALMVGVLTDKISARLANGNGEPLTAIFCAAMLLIFAVVIWVIRPEVRRME
jgi:MFS family permease